MTIQYEGKEPCCSCIHRKVCNAKICLNELKYTIVHPFFKIKVECTEYYDEQLATMAKTQSIKESDNNDT